MTIGKKIALGFAVPVALLILVGLLARSISDRQTHTTSLVEHTQEVKLVLQRLLTRVVDAETSARAFYFVADEGFLDRYRGAQADVDRLLASLDKSLVDSAEERSHIEALGPTVSGRIRLLTDTIERPVPR